MMNFDFDRDRHQHNGLWFERVAPHSPHYVQCSPDKEAWSYQHLNQPMDVEKMSNEELIDAYWHGGCDHACDHVRVAYEIQARLRTPTHPKCGTCYKCAYDEGRHVCINGDSPMCTEDVDPKLDYCRFHKPQPKEEPWKSNR